VKKLGEWLGVAVSWPLVLLVAGVVWLANAAGWGT
jgi:hypothetical protein